jgi:Endosomal/lysosomal potassium channel TMEM175
MLSAARLLAYRSEPLRGTDGPAATPGSNQDEMQEEPSELTEELRSRISRIEMEARDKARLKTFIDAVFAIAITLLGLEFVVPLLQHSDQALAGFLFGVYPKFVGYFLAFFLLGILHNSNWPVSKYPLR